MLAAKTYMYLPLFLAKEKGIFKSVFEAKRIKDDIEFRICDGDDDAIDSMLDFNRNARKCKLDEIAIAISDPTSILRQHKSFDNKTDIKVIGKLINKLPFWVICPYNEELDNNSHNGFMDIKELKAKRLYTPNSSYITANSCCSQLLNKNNYKIKPVDFSEEIEKCINDSESIALTGDLNLMARKYIENKICIYSHMANNNDESIATTIITSRYICKQYEDMLALVLEAIQKAIFIIYSSPEIATEVCYKISDEIDSYRMPDENIQKEKTDQEKYEAVVYNKTGRKLMSHKFSSEYNKLLLGEKELLLAGNYHCSIVNFAGHEMFKKDFKKRIVNISPTGKRQKYLITYENSTNLSEIY